MTNDNEEILSEIEEVMNSLTKNDKIVINSLSFLAEDYKENAEVYPKIVTMIENKLKTVPSKLPFLYLIDSIMKNVGEPYVTQFGENLVSVFTKSFEETHDPQHRKKLYDLRKTWVDVFPNEKLFSLDRRVNAIDPAWPIAALSADEGRVIHVNPKFLKAGAVDDHSLAPLGATSSNSSNTNSGGQKVNSGSSSSSPASSSSSEERRPPPETRPISRPLQLPLPPFYHDVPRPNELNSSKLNSEPKTTPVTKVTNASTLRDPRLKKMEVDTDNLDVDSSNNPPPSDVVGRKRKLDSKDEGPSHKRDIFLIDREGDNSIEKRATRKKNKKTKKPPSTVKTKEDQDMREALPMPSTLPTPEEGASDVDMRPSRPPLPPPLPPPPPGPLPGHMRVGLPPPSNFMPDNGPPPHPAQFPRFNRPPMMGNPPHPGIRPRMPPPMNGPVGPFPTRPHRGGPPPPPPPPPPPNIPMRPQGGGRPNGPGGAFQRDPVNRGLKIDKPRWHVSVPGFDEMPEIGVDPRLLNPSRSKGDEAVQEVTINRCSYTLLLDRLQPLINVNGLNHAVRFRVDFLKVLFTCNHRTMSFQIPGNNFTRITINMKQYTVCIGGPHHELIIDGVAYPVAFNGAPTTIPMRDNSTVSVEIITPRPRGLDVLPAIPPHILKWASESFFGPATLLHLPPLNPVERMEAAAAAARAAVEPPPPPPKTSHDIDATVSQATTSQAAGASCATTSSSLPASTPNVDVFQLYEKLVKVGLLAKKEAKPKMDLDAFKINDFLEPNTLAKDDLYEGYQCLQCGLRYLNPESEEFTAHMDYHFLTNNSRERSDRKSRSYFESADVWLTGTCGPADHDGSDSENDANGADDDSCLPTVEAHSDDSLNICSVCFEKFEVKYSDDADAWVLINAVKKDGLFFHPTCVEDAWKGVAVDMAVDPHLALKKVLEGKMEAVFKPELDDASSDFSSDDNVEVVVQNEASNEKEESCSSDKPTTPVKVETPSEKVSSHDATTDVQVEDDAADSDEPAVASPGTPLQDEFVVEPQTPVKDESPFSSSAHTTKKDAENDNPSTPVQDEVTEASNESNSCPGTPVCDEIAEPSTPVKDEPIWS